MKKALIAFGMLLLTAGTAHAGGLVHSMSSSVQLTVDAARTTSTRLGSQYSISGSGVNTTDGTTAGTQASNGNAFSYSNSYIQGDAVPTSAPSVGAVGNFSSQTSYGAGAAGDLAGTLSTAGAISLTAGGAGTSATGQFVSEITVID